MRTVYYPGPSVSPDLYDVEQVHHAAGVHLRRGAVDVDDDLLAQQLVECGLVTAEPTAESRGSGAAILASSFASPSSMTTAAAEPARRRPHPERPKIDEGEKE